MKPIPDGTVRRLALRPTLNGPGSYVVSYRDVTGHSHRYIIGRDDTMTRAAARKEAIRVNGRIDDGKDPAGARREAREAPCVRDLVESYLATQMPARASSQREYKSLLATIDKRLGSKKVADVRRPDAKAAHSSMAASPIRANRLATIGSMLFKFAVSEEMIERNPWEGVKRFAEHSRERVLDDAELTAIWRATDGAGSFNKIVRVLLLTAQRRSEVGGMAWSELSNDLATWTIPKDRAKNDKQHVVPLSAPVRELLRGLPRSHELVFPGQRGEFSGWSKSKAALDAKSRVAGWRLHDLRRTAATGLQRLGVRLEVTEKILNHISGSRAGIVGVYQRHDFAKESRAALEAWSAHVLGVVEGRAESSNVLSYPQAG